MNGINRELDVYTLYKCIGCGRADGNFGHPTPTRCYQCGEWMDMITIHVSFIDIFYIYTLCFEFFFNEIVLFDRFPVIEGDRIPKQWSTNTRMKSY